MALLLGLLSVTLPTFIADLVIHPLEPEKLAYPFEVRESVESQPEEVPEAILVRLASADRESGQSLAQTCMVCHSFSEGGTVGVGPALWDIVGQSFLHDPRFSYSPAFQSRGSERWTYETLDQFLTNPQAYIPGTRMSYIGLSDPQERADLIGWLRTLSSNPEPLP